MKKVIIFLFSAVILCISCKSIFEPKNFKYCYTENGDNNIAEFLNVNGYYIAEIPNTRTDNDTVYITTLFYKDGSFITTGDLVGGKRDSTDFKQVEKNKPFHFYVRWGAYKIREDSIFTQYIEEISSWQYYTINRNYKILNRNMLVGTYITDNSKSVEYEMKFVSFSNNFNEKNPLRRYKWYKCK